MSWFDRWWSWLSPWRKQSFAQDQLRAAVGLAKREADWRLQHDKPLPMDDDLLEISIGGINAQRKLEQRYKELVYLLIEAFQWDQQAIYQHVHRDVGEIIWQERNDDG